MKKDNIALFWHKYIEKTVFYGIKPGVGRWDVKRYQHYIKQHDPLQLAEHTPEVIHRYLQDLVRNIWGQSNNSLQLLYVDLSFCSEL